jgi:hypothetical protein
MNDDLTHDLGIFHSNLIKLKSIQMEKVQFQISWLTIIKKSPI